MMRPIFVLNCILLITGLQGLAAAEVAAPPDAAQLLATLPRVAEIVRQGDAVLWRTGEVAVPVIGMEGRDPLVTTAAGPVRVARWLIQDHRLAALRALPGLAERGRAAGFTSGLTLQDGVLTGPSLRANDVVVVGGGVMRRQDTPRPAREADVARIAAATGPLLAALPRSGLDAIGQRALEEVLTRLGRTDQGLALDEIWPSFARRVVRHGWLRRWFHAGDADAAAAMEQAVVDAERMVPMTVFAGDGLLLEEVADAFGHGGWVHRSPQRVLFAHPEAKPEYLGRVSDLMVVVELPADADPAAGAGRAVAARILAGQDLLAYWSADGGFVSDAAHWRQALHVSGEDLVSGILPPHIVIADLHGDVAGLAVAKGLLRPAADGGRAAAERFLDDAARLLPDAAHLDLIGEYLFTYVYPSPDAQHPELMGNKQVKSNVQQTVWQTCGNVTGGLMRGDCADIAELYHVLVERQGRNPVVIGLPEHAACAWAEQRGASWQVFVLQTGPPMAFSDPDLRACLGKAYHSFDPGMAFDPDQISLLLRFSGEVSRSAWALSWRIFRDPAYARTMYDVQRDWHYQTYQRGIAAMKRLIAGGDDDSANYRELAGLSAATGQFNLTATYHRQAMEHTPDAANRLTMGIELVGHLLRAERVEEARTLATGLLERDLPALKDGLGEAARRVALDLAMTCADLEGGPALQALSLRILDQELSSPLGEVISNLATLCAGPAADRANWDDAGLRSLRVLVAEYCALATELVRRQGHDRLPGDATVQGLSRAVQRWLDGVAFHDVEEDSAVMGRYAAAGQWYAAVLGEAAFDRRLEAATPPATVTVDHKHRLAGAAQMERDLPWIRASVPYWYARLAELFRRDRASIDAAQVARLAAHLAEARAATARLGLADTWSETRAELGALIAALVAQDEAVLRRILRRVKERNDKELRDDAAQWLGDAARFLDTAWYARVLEAWRDEVDYKPKYFWIAWRAALGRAPQQALMAGRLAAERFADDASFAEEYGFMRSLLEPAPVPVPQPAGVR